MFKPSELKESELEDLLSSLAGRVEASGNDWANAKANYEQLSLFEKTVLYNNMPTEGSVEDRKKIAYTSKEYIIHLEGLASTHKDLIVKEAKHKSEVCKFEAIKSIFLKRVARI